MEEILHQLIGSLSHLYIFLSGFIPPMWWLGISSINSSNMWIAPMPFAWAIWAPIPAAERPHGCHGAGVVRNGGVTSCRTRTILVAWMPWWIPRQILLKFCAGKFRYLPRKSWWILRCHHHLFSQGHWGCIRGLDGPGMTAVWEIISQIPLTSVLENVALKHVFVLHGNTVIFIYY